MITLLTTLAIVSLLYGSRASFRTFATQMGDPANRLLVAACVVVIACGLLT
jgi:hypothetical protein